MASADRCNLARQNCWCNGHTRKTHAMSRTHSSRTSGIPKPTRTRPSLSSVETRYLSRSLGMLPHTRRKTSTTSRLCNTVQPVWSRHAHQLLRIQLLLLKQNRTGDSVCWELRNPAPGPKVAGTDDSRLQQGRQRSSSHRDVVCPPAWDGKSVYSYRSFPTGRTCAGASQIGEASESMLRTCWRGDCSVLTDV